MHRRLRPFVQLSSLAAFQPPAAEFEADEYSIDLNGTDEELGHDQTSVKLGYDQTWSMMLWVKPSIIAGRCYLQMGGNASGGNRNAMRMVAGSGGNETDIRIIVYNQTAGQVKNWYWTSAVTNNAWNQIVTTWDAGAGSGDLKLYVDGSEVTSPTKDIDNSPNQNDEAYEVWIGNVVGTLNQAGVFYSAAAWSSVLTSGEVSTIYNSGDGSAFDLASDSGSYTSSADLIRWFRLGKDPADMGIDAVDGNIDVMTDAQNVTSGDDRVNQYPGEP